MIHREGDHTWKRSLETVPYLVFFIALIIMGFSISPKNLIAIIFIGVILLIGLLIVVPIYASKAASLGVFGSPCRWGFHIDMVQGRKIICTKCKKVTDYGHRH